MCVGGCGVAAARPHAWGRSLRAGVDAVALAGGRPGTRPAPAPPAGGRCPPVGRLRLGGQRGVTGGLPGSPRGSRPFLPGGPPSALASAGRVVAWPAPRSPQGGPTAGRTCGGTPSRTSAGGWAAGSWGLAEARLRLGLQRWAAVARLTRPPSSLVLVLLYPASLVGPRRARSTSRVNAVAPAVGVVCCALAGLAFRCRPPSPAGSAHRLQTAADPASPTGRGSVGPCWPG